MFIFQTTNKNLQKEKKGNKWDSNKSKMKVHVLDYFALHLRYMLLDKKKIIN